MTASMTPLHDEHRGLLPQITALRTTADGVGDMPTGELRTAVASRVEFLRDHLTPHAQAEDEVLYPVVARLMGGPDATATMRRDHIEVHRLTGELADLQARLPDDGPVDDALAKELRRVLYGLFAVVSLHFAEEEVYLPVLEQGLTPNEADDMFAAMSAAHHRLVAHH